ncbi:Co2+/Mg2+ efflux protein ApaG [Halothiobacillus sp. DCM-1]|uniref:Co2+/Mg2+ efflux protein ApaG n=1 Tax=Halothiobacillus sp. DCM-1 TaxID=3112558 RepID=UPI003253EF97
MTPAAPHPLAAHIEVIPRAVYVAEHSDPERQRFAFGYEIQITNHSAATVQLRDRHWLIDHGNGSLQEVRGEGVVGEQPVLGPDETHRYRSGAIIETPAGQMWGDYGFTDSQGTPFRVAIPLFHLLAPAHLRPLQ